MDLKQARLKFVFELKGVFCILPVMTIESEKKKPAVAWEDMNDEQLLNVRIRDLNLNLKDSALEKRIQAPVRRRL